MRLFYVLIIRIADDKGLQFTSIDFTCILKKNNIRIGMDCKDSAVDNIFMEGILFTGIQGSGKSTFYIQNFFNSHIRISLDLLKTRNREKKLLLTSLETSGKIVIDNTNPTTSDREKYIELFKEYKYIIIGYYFESKIKDCMERNTIRNNPVPEKGVLATYNKLQLPSYGEGFDQLFYVRIVNNTFIVEDWKDEI